MRWVVCAGVGCGGLVAEITMRLAVVNVTVVGNSQHHWHPPWRVRDALFRLTAPDGRTSELGLGGGANDLYL